MEHQPLFALRLAQIRLGADYDYLFDILLKASATGFEISSSMASMSKFNESMLGEGKLSKTQVKALDELALSKLFSNLSEVFRDNEDTWSNVMDHPNAECVVPDITNQDGKPESDIVKELKKLTVLRILRPDRFIAGVKNFVAKVLGE